MTLGVLARSVDAVAAGKQFPEGTVALASKPAGLDEIDERVIAAINAVAPCSANAL
jgi:hypothetical protein